MPFTLSHPAAVLPLLRRPFSAAGQPGPPSGSARASRPRAPSPTPPSGGPAPGRGVAAGGRAAPTCLQLRDTIEVVLSASATGAGAALVATLLLYVAAWWTRAVGALRQTNGTTGVAQDALHKE